jgi:hypothetical protein
VAREPAEIIGLGPGMPDTLGRFKTSNLKNNTLGIGKRMLMGILNFNPLGGAGDGPATLSAENGIALVPRMFFCFFLDGDKDIGIGSLRVLGGNPQQAKGKGASESGFYFYYHGCSGINKVGIELTRCGHFL